MFQTLNRLQPTRVRHGDCLGADAEFNEICWLMNIPIEVHPPKDPSMRAFCTHGVVKIHPEKGYLPRDRDIVNACEVLVGAPYSSGSKKGGGTWYTVEYAVKKKKDWVVCYTNGTYALSRPELWEERNA